MLKIYNSFTRSKEAFKPITPNQVKMYVCGITVYDYCHIGHARSMVAFDMVVRYLRWMGWEVTFVRNITDIDDKIIQRANENGEAIDELTKRFISAMHEDQDALGLLSPDFEPPATKHLDDIIQMVQDLIANGSAYVGKNGDVFFDVRKFKAYGALSNRDVDDMRSGARVDVVDAKQDPLDFVLWKLSKEGEPSWESPWGAGRPGWHIECSAMSTRCLGETFDIHGGGIDLIFPHHENEVAQSEAATGQKFANTWMHCGLLQINKEKMSKSLGNFITIRDALSETDSEVLRFFMLSSHYRKPVNYSDDNLKQAHGSLETLYLALREVEAVGKTDESYKQLFIEAMNDDFNTPGAIAVLFDIAKELNIAKQKDSARASQLAKTLLDLAGSISLLQRSATDFLQSGVSLSADEVEKLIEARNKARAEKNWSESDRIRDELKAQGIELEAGAGKTTWRNA